MSPLNTIKSLISVHFVVLFTFLIVYVCGSEFPGRECCINEDYEDDFDVWRAQTTRPTTRSTTPTTTNSSQAVVNQEDTVVNHTNHNTIILNCTIAKELCRDDGMCSTVLDVTYKLCGREIVACSTATIIKCQAAINTLQTFPFFKPTCLCKEPNIDPECNVFQTFLFDHPCLTARPESGTDPYLITSLTSCTQAAEYCNTLPACSRVYNNFLAACPVNEAGCTSERLDECRLSYIKVRMTPLFGCICMSETDREKCERIFRTVNYNSCISKDMILTYNAELTNFQSTCHYALEECLREKQCNMYIQQVIKYCKRNQCHQQECMTSLQTFYRAASLQSYAIEVAFCICKKTGDEEETICIDAQNILHPTCAQQVNTVAPLTCRSIANECKREQNCSKYLQNFERSCAADNETHQCAGYPSKCRSSMLGILGTKLRANCVCRLSEQETSHECEGWQRILWFNPCVVESQRDFHIEKVRQTLRKQSEQHGLHHSSFGISDRQQTPATESTTAFTTSAPIAISLSNALKKNNERGSLISLSSSSSNNGVVSSSGNNNSSSNISGTSTSDTINNSISSSRSSVSSTVRTTGSWQEKSHENSALNESTKKSVTVVSSSTTTMSTSSGRTKSTELLPSTTTAGSKKSTTNTATTSTSTTATPTTIFSRSNYHRSTSTIATSKVRSSFAPRSTATTKTANHAWKITSTAPESHQKQDNGCLLQKTVLDEYIFIPTGKGVRVYHDNELECTEVCLCNADEILTCETECIKVSNCYSNLATYTHGNVAYKGHRSQCICYSGSFLCVRPESGTYTLPPGIFMFLAFSTVDKQLMNKHRRFDISDTISELEEFMNRKISNTNSCRLSLYSVSDDNVIVIAKSVDQKTGKMHATSSYVTNEQILQDKESCLEAMITMSNIISQQRYDFISNIPLSIYKLAEPGIVFPTNEQNSKAMAEQTEQENAAVYGGKSVHLCGSVLTVCFSIARLQLDAY